MTAFCFDLPQTFSINTHACFRLSYVYLRMLWNTDELAATFFVSYLLGSFLRSLLSYFIVSVDCLLDLDEALGCLVLFWSPPGV